MEVASASTTFSSASFAHKIALKSKSYLRARERSSTRRLPPNGLDDPYIISSPERLKEIQLQVCSIRMDQRGPRRTITRSASIIHYTFIGFEAESQSSITIYRPPNPLFEV